MSSEWSALIQSIVSAKAPKTPPKKPTKTAARGHRVATEAEERFIARWYPLRSAKQCARVVKSCEGFVNGIASRLGVWRLPGGHGTDRSNIYADALRGEGAPRVIAAAQAHFAKTGITGEMAKSYCLTLWD